MEATFPKEKLRSAAAVQPGVADTEGLLRGRAG